VEHQVYEESLVNGLWPKRTSLTPGEKNVVNPPLILPEKIFLPPLHIKLGLVGNFVKGMEKTGRGLEYVRNNFPNVSDAKIKEVIFIGPRYQGTDARQNSSMKN